MRFSFAPLLLLPLSSLAFNPTAYERDSVTCKALKRHTDELHDVHISYVDVNPTAKTTLIFVHGWPSVWSTWARQIEEFENDYRLIVPDLRGFGRSTHPEEVKALGLFDYVGDLACLLDNADIAEATNLRNLWHDWGASVCYEAGRARPDIFNGVVGAVVPYIPSEGDFVPMSDLAHPFPRLTYQLFFDLKTKQAVKELDSDIRRSLRSTLRAITSPPPEAFLEALDNFLGAWSDHDEIPPIPFYSQEEEDYMVEEFSIQGYQNTLQFYTTGNRHRSWRHAHMQGNHTLLQPVLAIYPTHDPVADWPAAAKVLDSEKYLPDLTTELVEGAHWVHIENPIPFNDALRRWLEKHFSAPKHDEL